ncbi:MAG: zinc ribbon domain-containing protein, partial [Rhodospirillaceae bacterium]
PEPEADAAARDDNITQPAWPATPQTLPDGAPAPLPEPGPVASPWLTVAPDDGAAPQWPANPQWGRTASGREVPSTLAGRPLLPRDDAAALWAASAREVLSGGPASSGPAAGAAPVSATPQPCVSCGLSLSANARFCRRCGTRQG